MQSVPGGFAAGGTITGNNLSAILGVFSAAGQFTDSTTAQSVFLTAGVPGAGLGQNGDYAFNQAGAVALTHLYQKVAGVWTGLL